MLSNLVFDTLYLVGSLLGPTQGRHVCAAKPPVAASVAQEVRLRSTERPWAVATAFIDVTVVPMDAERLLPHQTVIVENGRITALGAVGKVKIPAGATRVDGKGKYLMPGLTDMHTHFWYYFRPDRIAYAQKLLFAQLADGVTSMRHTVRVSPVTADLIRNSEAAKTYLIPRVYLAGKLEPLLRLGLTPDSAIALYKAAGYQFLVDDGNRDTLLVPEPLIVAGRRAGLPMASHTHRESPGRVAAIGAQNGSIEHEYWASVLPSTTIAPQRLPMPDTEIRDVAAQMRRIGAWITPTLACYENFETRHHVETLKIRRKFTKALYDAGVPLLFGAEGGYVHDELTALISAGLTPYQALVTGTRNPAAYFGLQDSVGTVAVGKWADLVLLHGNPIADIRHAREPAGVMRGGRWLDRAELDRRLLGAPRTWFRWVEGSGDGPIGRELEPRLTNVEVLADSIWNVRALPPSADRAHRLQRLWMSQAEELGAMRAKLNELIKSAGFEEPRSGLRNLDAMLRAWGREQARQGYQLVIPGFTFPS